MKTYVITVSRYFPTTHPRKGEPTGFVDKILSGEKIHTIRGNVALWTKRLRNVGEGKALLSLRYWEGKPYNSKQIEFLQLRAENRVGVEKIALYPEYAWVQGEQFTKIPIANNDGLSLQDFNDWFGYEKLALMMVCIHFTDFRYV